MTVQNRVVPREQTPRFTGYEISPEAGNDANSGAGHQQFKYDVCLSFASEQRNYVMGVKERLVNAGLRVFFDQDEQTSLWGNYLNEKLDKVYRKDSRFCVMFISAAYAKKMWTNLERRSVQARVLGDRSDYLLPARFDDTEIEGLHPTVAYIDLRTRTPEEFALLVIDKVRLQI